MARSIVAAGLIPRGEVLTAPMLAFKRTDIRFEPGFAPREAHRVIGRRAARPIQADETIKEALTAVGLPALADRLDEEANWSLRLSPGEQQRLAIARALVFKPDWLFLDEATASLDEPTEAAIYGELKRRLPATAPRGQVKRLEVEPALGAVRLALAEVQAGGARIPSY